MSATLELPAVRPAALPAPTCFVLGGVALEMCPAPGVAFALGEDHRNFAGAYSTSPVAGQAHAVVSPAPDLADGATREIRWAWDRDVARIETGRVRAELRRLSAGRYAASALVVPDEAGCSSLVTALASAIVSRERGLILHAAGVEIDGRAVLFIGPSGAGKTTAANHCPGARWIARDRAAIYPTPLGWYAAGMPGGDDVELPRSPGRVFPLGAIYRVVRADGRAVDRAISLATAMRDLRESVQSTAGAPEEEDARHDSIEALCASVPVARLETLLGSALTGLVRKRLGRSR